jgi:hypothetical protein
MNKIQVGKRKDGSNEVSVVGSNKFIVGLVVVVLLALGAIKLSQVVDLVGLLN